MLEEERFFKTIASGIELFNEELKNTKETFSGEVAFKLYDTFGFPLGLDRRHAYVRKTLHWIPIRLKLL